MHPVQIKIETKNNRKWNVNGRRILLDIQKQNSAFTLIDQQDK